LEPRRRSEQALVEQMGLHRLGKDQIFRLCGGLDEQVWMFRERPLEGAYPYL
jgi:transposase-like protein